MVVGPLLNEVCEQRLDLLYIGFGGGGQELRCHRAAWAHITYKKRVYSNTAILLVPLPSALCVVVKVVTLFVLWWKWLSNKWECGTWCQRNEENLANDEMIKYYGCLSQYDVDRFLEPLQSVSINEDKEQIL